MWIVSAKQFAQKADFFNCFIEKFTIKEISIFGIYFVGKLFGAMATVFNLFKQNRVDY